MRCHDEFPLPPLSLSFPAFFSIRGCSHGMGWQAAGPTMHPGDRTQLLATAWAQTCQCRQAAPHLEKLTSAGLLSLPDSLDSRPREDPVAPAAAAVGDTTPPIPAMLDTLGSPASELLLLPGAVERPPFGGWSLLRLLRWLRGLWGLSGGMWGLLWGFWGRAGEGLWGLPVGSGGESGGGWQPFGKAS